MNIQDAKQIKIADYLQSLGYSPVKQQSGSLWYKSPFRRETEASFKAKEKRQELTDLLNDVISELNSGSSQDKMLARATKAHLQKLPPVKSAAQEAVSSLTDKAIGAKQAEIKRAPAKNR